MGSALPGIDRRPKTLVRRSKRVACFTPVTAKAPMSMSPMLFTASCPKESRSLPHLRQPAQSPQSPCPRPVALKLVEVGVSSTTTQTWTGSPGSEVEGPAVLSIQATHTALAILRAEPRRALSNHCAPALDLVDNQRTRILRIARWMSSRRHLKAFIHQSLRPLDTDRVEAGSGGALGPPKRPQLAVPGKAPARRTLAPPGAAPSAASPSASLSAR